MLLNDVLLVIFLFCFRKLRGVFGTLSNIYDSRFSRKYLMAKSSFIVILQSLKIFWKPRPKSILHSTLPAAKAIFNFSALSSFKKELWNKWRNVLILENVSPTENKKFFIERKEHIKDWIYQNKKTLMCKTTDSHSNI